MYNYCLLSKGKMNEETTLNFMVQPRFLDAHSVEMKLKMGSPMVPMIKEFMFTG